ncbi:MAG: hypothetical protein Fur0037_27520 [Planctomycetota bacterium]
MAEDLAKSRLGLAVAALFVAGPVAGQAAAEKPRPEPFRLYVIGASVSGGFEDGPLTGAEERGDSVPISSVLKVWVGPIGGRVASFPPLAMQGLFEDPEGIGEKEIAAAIRSRADLVVGIDYLFWFGYGRIRGRSEREERLAKLERGLALLDRLPGTVLIGTFPDMSGAAPRMLAPSWIPSPGVLDALNARLGAWAAEHDGANGRKGPRVLLFPLGDLVEAMKRDGLDLRVGDTLRRCPPGSLLQGDRLHANRLGMAWLGFRIQEFVRESLGADHPLSRPSLSLEQFADAISAAGDLEALSPAKETARGG